MRSDELLEHSLPSNEEAEQVVLGAILLDNESGEEAFKTLEPMDFYNPINRRIFASMQALNDVSANIDPISIGEHMKAESGQEALVSIGGVTRITNLTMGLPHFSDTEEYVKLIKKHSVSRKAIRLFNSLTQDILYGQDPIEDIIEEGESKLLLLSNRVHSDDPDETRKGFWDLSEITPALEQQFRNYNAGIATGCPTGMKELDDLLDGGGLQPGGVYLVGAAEKTGKTSLALDWAQHAASELNYTVPVVTLEMAKETLAKRLYSSRKSIPYYMFRPGFYDSPNDDSFTRAIEGLQEFGKLPIKIADRLFGLPEIARHLRRVVEQGLKVGQPVKYGIVDYLQLIEDGTNQKNVNREREVSAISRGLKKLASELDIALVVMTSFNKEGLDAGQEPSARNLRDSGSLAFDAEAIILLHNPAFIPGKPYEQRPVTDITLILHRQRNGPTGRIALKFIGPYMTFLTERQYRQAQQGDDLPKSMGQMMDEDKELDKLWGEEDKTKSYDDSGPDF